MSHLFIFHLVFRYKRIILHRNTVITDTIPFHIRRRLLVKWMCTLTLLAVLSSSVQAQLNALETTADARALALGQSTVADIFSQMSGIGNPATLSGVRGISAFYQDRRFDYLDFLSDYHLRVGGIALETSIGSFSLSYRRVDLGEMDITEIAPNPRGYVNVGRARVFNYVGALSYALKISDPIALGVTGKFYDLGYDWIWGGSSASKTTPAYLFDVGILYRSSVLSSSERIFDQLRIGTSLENFGTDLKNKTPPLESARMPRYWRFGFSWLFTIKKDNGFEFLHLVLNGEYRKELNPDEYEELHTDFWGIGAEFRLLTIVAVRIGEEIQPYDNVFGKAGQWNMRYGIGIKLSPQQFGYQLPVFVSFDYAVIPLYDANFYFGPLQRNQIKAFTVALSYELPLF